jgi:hypothetical protein
VKNTDRNALMALPIVIRINQFRRPTTGCPLLNRNGQVVGIVTALANPTEQDFFIGIGFAVPINIAGGAAGLPSY